MPMIKMTTRSSMSVKPDSSEARLRRFCSMVRSLQDPDVHGRAGPRPDAWPMNDGRSISRLTSLVLSARTGGLAHHTHRSGAGFLKLDPAGSGHTDYRPTGGHNDGGGPWARLR